MATQLTSYSIPQLRPSIPKEGKQETLPFHRPNLRGVQNIYQILTHHRASRACDWTVGGIMMWADYFDYQTAIIDGTLYVRGRAENDIRRQAFSLPVGPLPLEQSIETLRKHCQVSGDNLLLSGVPADLMEAVEKLNPLEVRKMEGWSDYVYDINSLATLSGKKLSKKRNHVNRFMADNPDFQFEPLNPKSALAARDMLQNLIADDAEVDEMEYFDRQEVMWLLETWGRYGMWEGWMLSTKKDGPVAFTIGEIAGDTLVTHVEKVRHTIPGAGEAVNSLFAQQMRLKYPHLRYVNREEDLGIPGLRQAKLTYRPSFFIDKYQVQLRV